MLALCLMLSKGSATYSLDSRFDKSCLRFGIQKQIWVFKILDNQINILKFQIYYFWKTSGFEIQKSHLCSSQIQSVVNPLMLSGTYYANNYSGIIGRGLNTQPFYQAHKVNKLVTWLKYTVYLHCMDCYGSRDVQTRL